MIKERKKRNEGKKEGTKEKKEKEREGGVVYLCMYDINKTNVLFH